GQEQRVDLFRPGVRRRDRPARHGRQATEQAGCRGVHAGAGGEAVRPQPAGGGELLGVLRQVALAGPRGTGDEQVSPRTGESLVDKVPHRGEFSTPPYWFHLVIVVCRPFPPGPAAPSGILRASCHRVGRLRAGTRAAGRGHGGGHVVTGGQRGTKSHAASVSSWRPGRTPGSTAGVVGRRSRGGPVGRRVNPGTGGPVDRCGWPRQPPMAPNRRSTVTRNAETLMPTRDGRRLAVRSSGPVDGIPLLFHHGTPGAGRPVRAFERAAHARGCDLITYSRAGYGESTRRPGRSVADVASDMEDVLDHLGVTRCLVVGMSGGGPHALATAARLPGRVAGVLVIAGLMPDGLPGRELTDGMGEGNVVEFGLARQGEAALRAELEREAVALRDATAEELGEGMASVLSPADRAAL